MYERKPGLTYIWTGIIAIIVFSVGFLETAFHKSDIWWTNQDMKIPLEQSGKQVEVYIRDVKIDDIIKEGRLFVKSGLEMITVKKEDVKFRFNNVYKVKVAQIPFIILSTAGLTVGVMLIIYGAMLMLRKPPSEVEKKKK